MRDTKYEEEEEYERESYLVKGGGVKHYFFLFFIMTYSCNVNIFLRLTILVYTLFQLFNY